MHRFTSEQVSWLEVNIKGRCMTELAEMFNTHFGLDLKFSQVRAACHNRRLTSGHDCRFKPGQKAHNAGLKGWQAGGRAGETKFPKGHRPWNYQPVGSERRVQHHRGWFELQVKIADPNVWKAKHLINWEAEHGPLPSGMVLVFADQDRENIDVSNLIMVSRADLARLNQSGLISADPDLTRSGVAVAKVMTRMHQRHKLTKKTQGQ